MDHDLDRALTQELRNRDRDAWARVYDRHARDVFAFLAHLLHGDRVAAEELHQNTWLAALAGIDTFDSARGELRTWLFGIARRQAALYFRRSGRLSGGHTDVDSNSPEAADDGALAPPEILKRVERNDAVRAALATLGADARGVLLGKYVDGHSVHELAARLGRSPKAIESALSRARERMRGLLRWYFENEEVSRRELP